MRGVWFGGGGGGLGEGACGTLLAQNAAAAPSGPAGEVQATYNRLKPNVIKAAEKMPDADYQFKPVADIRTYARIVNHVTEAQQRVCSAMNGTTFDPKTVPSDRRIRRRSWRG